MSDPHFPTESSIEAALSTLPPDHVVVLEAMPPGTHLGMALQGGFEVPDDARPVRRCDVCGRGRYRAINGPAEPRVCGCCGHKEVAWTPPGADLYDRGVADERARFARLVRQRAAEAGSLAVHVALNALAAELEGPHVPEHG